MRSFFLYHHSTIYYSRWGKGEKILTCFHGYGEDADSFSFLRQYLENDFTIISIDLPYHGETKWDTRHPFYPANLVEILSAILEKEMLKTNHLYLLGYSMGGRIVLQLAEIIPSQIQKLILIAPDGLVVNPWYWLATQSKAGNKLFRNVMQQPVPFLKMILVGKRMGLVNKSVFKFVHHSLDNAQKRNELYLRWTALRKIKSELDIIQKNILLHKITVRFLYGKHDRIILSHRAEKFCEPLKELAEVKTINAGHQLLQEKFKDEIIQLLNH